MPNISKEEIKEICRDVGRAAFWLGMGILAYAGLVRWLVD